MISKEAKAKLESKLLADLSAKLDRKNSSDSQEALVWTEVECILNWHDDLYHPDNTVHPSADAIAKTIGALHRIIAHARTARTTLRRLSK
jgi:hypothetical protein